MPYSIALHCSSNLIVFPISVARLYDGLQNSALQLDFEGGKVYMVFREELKSILERAEAGTLV